VYPLRGAAHERHPGSSLSAVEIAAHEHELRTEQTDTAVLYRQEPGQLPEVALMRMRDSSS
jgi:hypothetical protein